MARYMQHAVDVGICALRWATISAVMVHIRFISTRCVMLRDIRMDHIRCIDDVTSPLGVAPRDYIPKAKYDDLGLMVEPSCVLTLICSKGEVGRTDTCLTSSS